MPIPITMPQLGESIVEGTVAKWLKAEGDSVHEYESLLEVDTDKVVAEVPSPASGTLLRILVAEGITVQVGSVIAWVGRPGEVLPDEDGAVPARQADPLEVQSRAQSPVGAVSAGRAPGLGFISPVVARIANEHHLDLRLVQGSGEGGRITKKDVLAYLEANQNGSRPAPWEIPADGDLFRPPELGSEPPTDPGPDAPRQDQLLPLNPMRRAIADHMAFSMRTAPHVTTVMEADMTAVAAHRQANLEVFARDGARLTFTTYMVAAVVAGLKAFPLVNASWSEDGILLHPAINVGLAVSLEEQGLVVPVIRDADGLSLLGLARAVNDLAARARTRRLKAAEVGGGTFTITNHGVGGSLFATPVINQPQCGILGVGAIQKRVVVIDDMLAIRQMVYLSFTFDHRVVDGYTADGFLRKVVEVLENWIF